MVSAVLDAALGYAAQGWPVFPCSPQNKAPLLRADKDANGKPIKGTGGVSKAVTHAEQIKTWWKRHPHAMVGLACGYQRLFVLDFDPRTNPETGESFDLDGLKAALERQMGCALPPSRTARTQSGGVHVWLTWPDDGGPAIRNRGNLPLHVDVRGLGGYVIAPPSVMDSGASYRWLKGRGEDHPIAEAPLALVEILRSKEPCAGGGAGTGAGERSRSLPVRASAPLSGGDALEAAVRAYGLKAFDEEIRQAEGLVDGTRNQGISDIALRLGSLVGAGALSETMVRAALYTVADRWPDVAKTRASIDSALDKGMDSPRDLEALAEKVAARQRRAPQRGAPPRAPDMRADLDPSSSFPPPVPDADRKEGASSHIKPVRRLSVEPEGGWEPDLTRRCAFHALTDMGNLERFEARFGQDFRYVEAWGWLAWDGLRWNRELAIALLSQAVRVTVRAIQEEAALIEESGCLLDHQPDQKEYAALRARMGARIWYYIDEDGEVISSAGEVIDREEAKSFLDRVVEIKANGKVVLFSDKVAQWGRVSESASHIKCLDADSMARGSAMMVALASDFDSDPMKLTVLNGTLRFVRSAGGRASVDLLPHDRADMITKLAVAAYTPEAVAPTYAAFIERVQPEADMRHFLDCWAGYNLLGDVSAQVFVLFYGQGANGKSVWVDLLAHIMGDYSRVCGIESFIDQGRYRKGSDATPDLAALAGRRMVRASEPEENSKFSDGLIKALTGTEPVPVRELLRPPFEMDVTFKVTISANNKPRIGTDHGIQRRTMLVPWDVIIPDDEQDKLLLLKLKAEADGVLARFVQGALAYLGNGLPRPDAVEAATAEYREENDLMGRFVADCVAADTGGQVAAKTLHELFAAWQEAMGLLPASGKPWSEKKVAQEMGKKGYKTKKSSCMWWLDVRLTKAMDYYRPTPGGVADGSPLPDYHDDVPF